MAGSGSTEAVWGEHEVDYILVITKDVSTDLNPNEVSQSRYVSQEELTAMLADDSEYERHIDVLVLIEAYSFSQPTHLLPGL